MNQHLFKIINSWAGQNVWLDHFMIFSAEWLGYFLILFLLVPLLETFFVRSKRISSWLRYILFEFSYYKNMILVSFGSAIVSRFIIVEVIRFFYPHPRPFLVLSDITQLVSHETTSSFPSGHASFYFALAMGVYLYNKKVGWFYLVAALIMGFARVFVGVHWPLDILGGAVLGMLVALIAKLFLDKKNSRVGI